MGQEVEQVAAEGRKLYKRLAKLTDHIVMLGGSLNKSVKAYNSMLGSLEHSVLPSARRMGKKLRVTSAGEGVIKEVPPIELAAGEVQAPELLRRDDEPITPDDIEAIDGDEPVEDDVPAMPQVASAKIAR
jgi:DNA recombination protein RmuC